MLRFTIEKLQEWHRMIFFEVGQPLNALICLTHPDDRFLADDAMARLIYHPAAVAGVRTLLWSQWVGPE